MKYARAGRIRILGGRTGTLDMAFAITEVGQDPAGCRMVGLYLQFDEPALHQLPGETGLRLQIDGQWLPGTFACVDAKETVRPKGIYARLAFVPK